MPSNSVQRYLPPINEKTRRWLRFLGVIAAIWLLFEVLTSLSAVVTPVVAAFAIAYILNPVVTWLEREKQVSRVLSATTGLAIIVVLAVFGLLIGGLQAVSLADRLPSYAERLLGQVQGWSIIPNLEPDEISDLAQLHGTRLVGIIGNLVGTASYFATVVVLVPLYTFFFLLEFNQIVATVRDHLPAEYRPLIVRIVTTIDRSIAAFFRGRVVVCTIVGLLSGLGWLIAGVNHSLLLGAAAGVLNLVPFLSIAVVPIAVIIAYLGNPDAWAGAVAAAAGVYFIVQAIESFLLTPLVESKSSGLHPVTTVIALLVGAQVAGLLGMLLAIPIASTLQSLGAEYILPEIRRLAAYPPAETVPATEPEADDDTPAAEAPPPATDSSETPHD